MADMPSVDFYSGRPGLAKLQLAFALASKIAAGEGPGFTHRGGSQDRAYWFALLKECLAVVDGKSQ